MAERWDPFGGKDVRPGADLHRHHFALATVAGLPAISLAFTALRFWARRKVGWGADDYTIFAASMLFAAVIYPSWRLIKMWHFGIHLTDVNQRYLEPSMEESYKIQLWFNICHNFVLPLVKASLLILLLRVGGVIDTLRHVIYVIFAFNALSAIVIGFMMLFMCPPRTGNTWAPTTFNGIKCFGRIFIGRLNIAQVSINMFTDLLIFPIPCFLTWVLPKAGVRGRILIVFLFFLSLSVAAIGAVKIFYTYNDRLFIHSSADWTYDIFATVNHWESCIAIVVACIPSIRILLLRWFGQKGLESQPPESGGLHITAGDPSSGAYTHTSNHESFLSKIRSPARKRGIYDMTAAERTVDIDLEKTGKTSFAEVVVEDSGSARSEDRRDSGNASERVLVATTSHSDMAQIPKPVAARFNN